MPRAPGGACSFPTSPEERSKLEVLHIAVRKGTSMPVLVERSLRIVFVVTLCKHKIKLQKFQGHVVGIN
jgi:hypothetical protein